MLKEKNQLLDAKPQIKLMMMCQIQFFFDLGKDYEYNSLNFLFNLFLFMEYQNFGKLLYCTAIIMLCYTFQNAGKSISYNIYNSVFNVINTVRTYISLSNVVYNQLFNFPTCIIIYGCNHNQIINENCFIYWKF